METIKHVLQTNPLKTCFGMPAKTPLNQTTAPATSFNSQNGEVNRKRMDTLFLQFAAFYGPIWRSQLKEEGFIKFMKNEWNQALIGFEDRVIDLAIEACKVSKELPPTLPKFIDICRGIKKKDAFIKIKHSDKPRTLSVAYTHLSQIKKQLGLKSQS